MRRWDNDERGHGAGDARAFLRPVQRLEDAMAAPDWVAEEPDAHLLPHIMANAGEGSPLRVAAVRVEDTTLVVELTWRERHGDWAQLVSDVYALIGSFAEHSTHVRQVVGGGRVEFAVTTGMLDGDGVFAAHGHTARLLVSGPRVAELLARTQG
jgi:hypothetical protein